MAAWGRNNARGSPPGTMRSAPPTRTGMTDAGVVRTGSSVGCFQSVYTGSHRHGISTGAQRDRKTLKG